MAACIVALSALFFSCALILVDPAADDRSRYIMTQSRYVTYCDRLGQIGPL